MSFMRLTDHEAAIWAASFIHHGADYRAVNAAAQAVADARRIAGELDKRQHEGVVSSEAAHMLRGMVNREEANRMDDDELGNALAWLDHRGHDQIADLLRAEYGIFWENDHDYTNGSLGPAGLAKQLDIYCPGCGSQAVWLRSSDGRQWRCGSIGHLGFPFEIDGVEAVRAKEWYAKWSEERLKKSSLYGYVMPATMDAVAEVGWRLDGDDDDFDDEDPIDDKDPDDDLFDDDLPAPEEPLHGRRSGDELVGQSPARPDDPLGLAGGPFDPGKFGR